MVTSSKVKEKGEVVAAFKEIRATRNVKAGPAGDRREGNDKFEIGCNWF